MHETGQRVAAASGEQPTHARSFPDGLRSPLESLRAVDLLVVELDDEHGVDASALGIELLGLMNDETDDSAFCSKSQRRRAAQHGRGKTDSFPG